MNTTLLEPCPHTNKLSHFIKPPLAWLRTDLSDDDWFFKISLEGYSEILSFLKILKQESLTTAFYAFNDLQSCQVLMNCIKSALDFGVGFAILDGLPQGISEEEAKAVIWMLSSLIAQPIQQDYNWLPLEDTVNTVLKNTTRTSVSPDYISLQVIQEGRTSCLASSYTIHNYFLEHHPQLLEQLYQPFYIQPINKDIDQQLKLCEPIFNYQDKPLRLLINNKVITGFEILEKLFADESLWFKHQIERGQIFFVNTYSVITFMDHKEDKEESFRTIYKSVLCNNKRRIHD